MSFTCPHERTAGYGYRGRRLTPVPLWPSQHDRLRGAVVYCVGACVAIFLRYIGPCCPLGAAIIASAQQRLFQLHPTSPNTMFGEPLSVRGGLVLASEGQRWHKRLSNSFCSR